MSSILSALTGRSSSSSRSGSSTSLEKALKSLHVLIYTNSLDGALPNNDDQHVSNNTSTLNDVIQPININNINNTIDTTAIVGSIDGSIDGNIDRDSNNTNNNTNNNNNNGEEGSKDDKQQQQQQQPIWTLEGVTSTRLEEILGVIKDAVSGIAVSGKDKGEGMVKDWFMDRQIFSLSSSSSPPPTSPSVPHRVDVVGSLLSRMSQMSFESRKCLGVIISCVVKGVVKDYVEAGKGGGGGGEGRKEGDKGAAEADGNEDEGNGVVIKDTDNMLIQPGHIPMLITLSRTTETALPAGIILRSGLRWERNLEDFLRNVGGEFWQGLGSSNFEIASDSFQTLRYSLVHNRSISSSHLTTHYSSFFTLYTTLLKSKSYITRRLSLKLLGEVLLMRENFRIMMRYISGRDNLITMMELLRDPKANIQYEAFHVFKVFVANPRKSDEVVKILGMNKEKLVIYLEGFHKEREGEGQFKEEKELVINTLKGMEYKK